MNAIGCEHLLKYSRDLDDDGAVDAEECLAALKYEISVFVVSGRMIDKRLCVKLSMVTLGSSRVIGGVAGDIHGGMR